GRRVSVRGPVKLKSPGVIEIYGDILSAAFFLVAGCILPGMKVIVKKVGFNPTRTGVIDILKKMGADIRVKGEGLRVKGGEPYGDIIVKSSELKGVTISTKEVVRAIDEIPVIMVAACFAKGKTVINGIKELRVKETDRVRSMVTNLRKLGADIEVKGEGCRVKGGGPLHGATVSSFGDHRTAMSMLIAGLAVRGVKVKDTGCIKKSFPGFQKTLRNLGLNLFKLN
ncbi:MAG: 3-phosphoshikimate 1-carboxyvinyltransferase, partial [Candidatus Omnitrophica bacterium]|nr:3-phosphoshikimate 1-carboxyvinyltransferase [Candidatus Omnitrophota bacterium]